MGSSETKQPHEVDPESDEVRKSPHGPSGFVSPALGSSLLDGVTVERGADVERPNPSADTDLGGRRWPRQLET